MYLSLLHKRWIYSVVCVGVGSVKRLNESPLAKHDKKNWGVGFQFQLNSLLLNSISNSTIQLHWRAVLVGVSGFSFSFSNERKWWWKKPNACTCWFATNGAVTAAIAAMLKVILYTFHSMDVIH